MRTSSANTVNSSRLREDGCLEEWTSNPCGCWSHAVTERELVLEFEGALCDRHFGQQHDALEEMTTEQIPMDL